MGALAQGINNTTHGLIWDNIASDRAMNDWRDQQYQNMENSWYLSNIDYANRMNMWRETGPVGMMKELEKAGLSEALIYKQGASGGQTAASVPNAPQATFQRGSAAGNVWAAGVQAAVADSAIEANKAQANKANAEADSIRGVAGTTGEAQISSLTQGIEESKARQALTEIQTQIGKTEAYIKTASAEDAIDRIKYDTQNALNKARSSMVEANIDEATQATKIDTIKQENTKIYLEQELLKATTDKTEATTQNIKQATQQIIQLIIALCFQIDKVMISCSCIIYEVITSSQLPITDRFLFHYLYSFPFAFRRQTGLCKEMSKSSYNNTCLHQQYLSHQRVPLLYP